MRDTGAVHISEKNEAVVKGGRVAAGLGGVSQGATSIEALFFVSFMPATQVESMTAAGPFMKFIEVIGRLHSVRESAG